MNQGEVCLTTSRVYVQEGLYDTFVERYVALARWEGRGREGRRGEGKWEGRGREGVELCSVGGWKENGMCRLGGSGGEWELCSVGGWEENGMCRLGGSGGEGKGGG